MPLFSRAEDTTESPASASVEGNTPPRRGRRGKDATSGPSALSKSEANDLKDKLIDLLTQGFEDTDKLLKVTSADKAEVAIWSTIDDREIEILADAWIDWGKSSVQGARIVKLVVSQWKKYQVAIILGPRFMETINFYAEHGMALPATRKRRQTTRTQASAGTRAQAAPAPVVDANTAAEQAQAAHAATLAARRNLIASDNTSDTAEGASNDAA